MTKPYYVGRRIDGVPRVFYVAWGVEHDITKLLEIANIVFISDLDWKQPDRQLVETAQTLIWHRTGSHQYVARFGRRMSWELFQFVEDGWMLTVDDVEQWLTINIVDLWPPLTRPTWLVD